MNNLKYVVIGNCQARPINDLLAHVLDGRATSLGTIITHLARNDGDEAEEHKSRLAAADLIFAQQVSDTFPVEYLRTGFLRSRFSNKMIIWPNLFFTGNSVGLAYVTSGSGRRIGGPLHEYQFLPIFRSWQNAESPLNCIQRMREEVEISLSTVEKSLEELSLRESSADVKVSDFIAGRWRRSRLFFTFNHPSLELLLHTAGKLIDFAGFKSNTFLAYSPPHEPLAAIVPPTLDSFTKELRLEYETTTQAKGRSLVFSDGTLKFGNTRAYTLEELVNSSYAALDSQQKEIVDVRITPHYLT